MRHVLATLAIAWYLLMPPGDPTAPLAAWTQSGAYDTAKACEDSRTQLMREPARMAREAPTMDKAFLDTLMTAIIGSRCVASTDPRLVVPKSN